MTKVIEITCKCGTTFRQIVPESYDENLELLKVYILDAPELGEHRNRPAKVVKVEVVTDDYPCERIIFCGCGTAEGMDADEQRWHSQTFEFVETQGDEALYRCPDCGALVLSQTGVSL